MTSLRTAAWKLLFVGSLVVLTACGGGGATFQASNTTLGQELQDLQQSYEKGIISEKEYERARKDLIEKHTSH